MKTLCMHNGYFFVTATVDVIVNWAQPKEELRQFLGLASFYCKYIEQFADIAASLLRLTQKDNPFNGHRCVRRG